MNQVVETHAPSMEIRHCYDQLREVLDYVAGTLAPFAEVAERADRLLGIESLGRADHESFRAAAGEAEMTEALERVCTLLRSFQPGCELP